MPPRKPKKPSPKEEDAKKAHEGFLEIIAHWKTHNCAGCALNEALEPPCVHLAPLYEDFNKKRLTTAKLEAHKRRLAISSTREQTCPFRVSISSTWDF